MKKTALTTITLTALIVAVLIWWYSGPQIVKRQTNALIDTLNITGKETRSFRMLKTGSFTNLLAQSAISRVNLENYRSELSYDELEAQHHLFVNNVGTSTVKADNMVISMMSDSQAEVTAELSLSLTGKNDAGFSEACKLTLIWEKNTTGKWRATRMDIIGK